MNAGGEGGREGGREGRKEGGEGREGRDVPVHIAFLSKELTQARVFRNSG